MPVKLLKFLKKFGALKQSHIPPEQLDRLAESGRHPAQGIFRELSLTLPQRRADEFIIGVAKHLSDNPLPEGSHARVSLIQGSLRSGRVSFHVKLAYPPEMHQEVSKHIPEKPRIRRV